MKKFLGLILALVLVLTCTTAFAEEAEQTYIQRIGYTPKVDKLTIQTTNRVIPEGNLVDTWLETQLGVQIDWIILSGGELSTKLNLLSASGELPDVITLPSSSNSADYDLLREQDLLIDLDDLLEKYGENILKSRTTEQIEALRDPDGKLYALNSNKQIDTNMMLIRRDWLQALNLEMPTTLEEFENVMRAFKEQDPDGNGENDTYGYYAYNESLINAFNIFFAAYDANPFQWVWADDGSIVFGATKQEPLVKAVTYINHLYKEGLVNVDYLTSDQQSMYDAALTDKQGCCDTQLWYADPYMQAGYLGSDTRDWTAIGGLYSEDGVGNGYLTNSNPIVRQYTSITADCKDPELAMLYLNLIADLDTLRFIRLGNEGEHHYYDEASGVYKVMPEFLQDNSPLINNGITATYAMPFFAEDPWPGQYTALTGTYNTLRAENSKPFFAAIYGNIPAIVDNMLNTGMNDFITQELNAMIMSADLDAEASVKAMVDKLYSDYNLEKQTQYANEYAQERGITKK